ncbi:hypothetical protein G6F65_021471 [Rhizopus arrhizus]|nr:hypothetical protein G6F65_021471 [Rhizopus arrhizus]
MTVGGLSRPVNSLPGSVDCPRSTPIYAPDSSVSTPETPSIPMRGRTTQNRESSRARLAASLSSATVATTREPSSLKPIAVTVPTLTSLYFTKVLPSSRPGGVRYVILLTGPSVIAG